LKISVSIPLIVILLILFGCAAQTNFDPVGRGNLNGNFSIGGPIISAFGTRIPVPYLTIGANSDILTSRKSICTKILPH